MSRPALFFVVDSNSVRRARTASFFHSLNIKVLEISAPTFCIVELDKYAPDALFIDHSLFSECSELREWILKNYGHKKKPLVIYLNSREQNDIQFEHDADFTWPCDLEGASYLARTVTFLNRSDQKRFEDFLNPIPSLRNRADVDAENSQSSRSVLQSLRSIMDSSSDAFFLIEFANGSVSRVLDANETSFKIAGKTKRQLLGMDVGSLVPVGSSSDLIARCQTCMHTGEPQSFEEKLACPFGIRYFSTVLNPVSSYDGDAFSIVGARRDVTEKKTEDIAIRASEEKYRDFFEESFDGLFFTSPNGRIVEANQNVVGILGYSTKEELYAIDLSKDVYAYPEDRERILEKIIRSGRGEYNVSVKKKNGDVIVAYCALTAMKNKQGEVIRFRGVIRDVTEKIRNKERNEALFLELSHANRLSVLGELACCIAHDVNQPLAAARTWLDVASRSVMNCLLDDQREIRLALDRIGESLVHATAVAQHFKDYIGKERNSVAPVSIGEAFAETVALLEHKIRKAGIVLAVDIPDSIPRLLGDKTLVQQVLVNLVCNAVEAMEQADCSTPTISVKAHTDGCFVTTSISDVGCGIDLDYSEIFNPFFSTKPNGLGLGLSICRRIIESLGGSISASKNSYRGATFSFTLPCEYQEDTNHAEN